MGSESWAVVRECPSFPSLAVVLQASVYTCDLPLHITSANLLLKSRYFSISYLES